MQYRMRATDEMVAIYFDLFVNRRAYTIQAFTRDKESGRCFYYRPKGRIALSKETIRRHLDGEITIGLYAIRPETQRCKWVAIDADYAQALDDLLKLQWELRQDGVDAALEKSRRGGHLWIFAAEPLLARDCRLYIHSLASRLKVPVKGAQREPNSLSRAGRFADGIEIFPRQNELGAGEFGNALRAPLGIHRGSRRRYWFYGADYNLESQLAYLARLKKITQEEMKGFIAGLIPVVKTATSVKPSSGDFRGRNRLAGREFSILDHIAGKKRRIGRNYFTRCPSCTQLGRDKSGDNLAISIVDPRKYRCWAGCSKEEIRAALGCPIPGPGLYFAKQA